MAAAKDFAPPTIEIALGRVQCSRRATIPMEYAQVLADEVVKLREVAALSTAVVEAARVMFEVNVPLELIDRPRGYLSLMQAVDQVDLAALAGGA